MQRQGCAFVYSYCGLFSALTTVLLHVQGPVELAAVGVSISVFNLVSKMFNVPLLNVTTSFVAEDAEEGVVNNLLSQPAAPTSTQSVTQGKRLQRKYRDFLVVPCYVAHICQHVISPFTPYLLLRTYEVLFVVSDSGFP